ncbi:MAG TPA: 2-oxoglutarate and iron-dependent oxygenase domain-containing protein [Candidatus Saccharimonadales bacterium]|nr:2-oxoglutarate and iron-dependent oxygenase domain-containing protein [Candidatus Saccharimonadales bacterium]
MGDQLRKYGFAVIAMHPEWADELDRMDGLARKFFSLERDKKERFKHPEHVRGYCPPGTISSDTNSFPQWPDSNERLIAGVGRRIPNGSDQLVSPLERSMLRCLGMAEWVIKTLMQQEAEIAGADPFFGKVARDEITSQKEPYQQLNFFGHKDPSVVRKDGEPLQVPHIDLTVATVLFARGSGGQPAPGLTVQLPDGTWTLLMAEPGEAIVSFQMELPNGVQPMRHFVTNPGEERRLMSQRISGAAFFNPDPGQDGVPEMVYQQAFGGAQDMFGQKFEYPDNMVS